MRSVLFVLGVAAVAAGCAAEPEFSTTHQSVLDGNRIATNRIATNRVSMNRVATNRIATNRIATNRLTLNRVATNSLLKDAAGRELLQYLIGCAIPPGERLEVDFEGNHYEFLGEIGLAPKWVDRPLRSGEKRWVSACIIARVNKFEIPMPISIRGPHEALEVTKSEAQDFTIEEGAFYGDIFRPLDEPIVWIACRGRGQAAGESGSLVNRDCAEPDPAHPGLSQCGFVYAGDCADFAPPKSKYACKRFVPIGNGNGHGNDCDDDDESNLMHQGGYYEDCHDEAGGPSWHGATKFDEVVTVFLEG